QASRIAFGTSRNCWGDIIFVTMVKGQMAYYAQFKPVDDHTFRLNTRIYLNVCNKPSEADKECIAAVVLMNPGSARPQPGSERARWEPLILDRDSTLPTIYGLFWDAYAKTSKPIPKNAFIQVWNLFYLCDPKAGPAFTKFKKVLDPSWCGSEKECKPRLVWFAWGKCKSTAPSVIKRFNCLKERFRLEAPEKSFYYGHRGSTDYEANSARIQHGVPSDKDFAKHPLYIHDNDLGNGYGQISDYLKSLL
ncbi:MAG: hypothetical protein ABSF22_20245, partial [Bryobacteraceae bacterium]